MLRTRVLTAVVLAPVILVVAWVREPWLSLLVLIAGVVALLEVTELLGAGGFPTSRPVTVLTGAAVIGAFVVALNRAAISAAWTTGPGVFVLGALPLLVLLAGIMILAGAALSLGQPRDGLVAWVAGVFAAAYLGLLVPMIAAVGHLGPPGGTQDTVVGQVDLASGTAWLLLLVLGVWSCDSGAYLVGRSIGRRQLAPRVSPGKTVEGLVGGLVAAVVVIGLTGTLLVGLAPWQAIVLGGLVGLIAPIGDLAKSMLKRTADRKESGSLFPGHGGMLDRLDSLLFGAAVVVIFALVVSGAGI